MVDDDRVDPSAHDSIALREAAANGYGTVVAQLLRHGRANPAATNNEAILSAATCGFAVIVELLLCDERVDATSALNSAVRYAAQRGHMNVVEYMLRDGRASRAHAIQGFMDLNNPMCIRRLECRERMTEICIAMHALALPTWVTLQVLDAGAIGRPCVSAPSGIWFASSSTLTFESNKTKTWHILYGRLMVDGMGWCLTVVISFHFR